MYKIASSEMTAYLPHRPPFIMVDHLVEAEGNMYQSVFWVAHDNVFLDGDTLREFALIENIAQTCAAGIGYLSRSNGNSAPMDGLMGGISKLTVFKLPQVEDLIETTVTKLQQFGEMYSFKGVCCTGTSKLLECELVLVGLPKK
ncbi:MAG: hypothetical protein JNJ57_02290 [Saprospiraceae bacterium]|nr:hypothetical protein [Saprospiraceae bacterium]